MKTMTGRDVLAVSRALHRLGYRWREPTAAYGWQMRDNVQLFRRRQNMNALGVYDKATHEHLAPKFDDYERWLYNHANAVPAPPEPMDEAGSVDARYLDDVCAEAMALQHGTAIHSLSSRQAHRLHV